MLQLLNAAVAKFTVWSEFLWDVWTTGDPDNDSTGNGEFDIVFSTSFYWVSRRLESFFYPKLL